MNANRELREKGYFAPIAASRRGSGEALVDVPDIDAGMDVLDPGCGDGTTRTAARTAAPQSRRPSCW